MASSIEAIKDKVLEALPTRSAPTDSQTIYVDTDAGKDDDSANGTESKPYLSLAYAYINHDTDGKSYVSRQSKTGAVSEGGDESERLAWKQPAKAAVKKAQNALDQHKKKLLKQQQVEAAEKEKEQQRLKNLEDAKKIVIKQDESLPTAVDITIANKKVALGEGEKKGTRVKVHGRIHRLRAQKQATFIDLIDGYGHLQCVLVGDLTKTYEALVFAQGTSLALYGDLRSVLAGQSAPDDRELHVDYFEVLGRAPTGEDAITNRVSAEQNMWDAAMLDARHLVLRGDMASSVMKVRSEIEWAFAKACKSSSVRRVPSLIMIFQTKPSTSQRSARLP